MKLSHATRFAHRQARLHAGDLYPDPWLLPRGFVRAMDPILAVALGPARQGGEALRGGLERALRGRPDGPLLLSLWAAAAAGEIPHGDLRALAHLMAEPLPDSPPTRGELRRFLAARVSPLASCILALVERREPQALGAATSFGVGLALTRLLLDLPAHLRRGRLPWPPGDLAACGVTREALADGLATEAVRRFLGLEVAWAQEEIRAGRPLEAWLGARLRRGLRDVARRASLLHRRLLDPRYDPLRSPPALRPRDIAWGRARALGSLARSVLWPPGSRRPVPVPAGSS